MTGYVTSDLWFTQRGDPFVNLAEAVLGQCKPHDERCERVWDHGSDTCRLCFPVSSVC